MELRHLRYFVAVATELHFTRAAERLGIGQPPLSQQIRQLEREVNAQLFVRDRRGVALTEAGQAFLVEARLVLEGADRARQAARRIASGELGALSMGFTVSASIHPFVPRLIRTFRGRYPGVDVSLVENSTLELMQRVHKGSVDLAFVRAPTAEMPGVRVETLLSEPMLAVIPATHALAGRDAIDLRELATEMFIFYPRKVGVGLYNAVVQACESVGFTPAEGIEVPQLTSVVTFVAAGMGVSVIPETMSQLQAEGVCYVPLTGQPPIANLAIAYRPKAPSSALKYAIELTRESARESPYAMREGR
ncbi:LysR family transcriptional regulator [Achromobacter aloeverae]|uniref:LysR family transcriptional regulator n=1 Tax=Achromobacter aloeverae TaxID=1750518 RepID=A0A4Q1HCG9_9BURK|nr:LysR family transcriptional regulator [Achromobacter aloeverae]RXN83360.1 LysR family transcriptional regulator [Achromobacter aloeverae]